MNYKINTNIGVVREENQDRAVVVEGAAATLALLCDGMGGHFGGSLAASITINTFASEIESLPTDKTQIFDWFKNTIKKCKSNMVAEAGNDEMKKDMGTTVTAAIIYKDTKDIYIFNIGDSRTYIFDGLLHQITVDHNLMNYYIIEENMSAFEASKLPGAAALTSALGPNKKTNIEAFTIDNSNEARTIILTSDGIHDYITKPNFEMIISGDGNFASKTDELIKQAIRGESTDNLTIIMLEVE